MDYFDKFTDEENIKQYMAFETYLRSVGEKRDLDARGIESTNPKVLDDPKFNSVIEDMTEYKSRQRTLVSASRSSSTVRDIYDNFVKEYASNCENSRVEVAKFLMNYLRVHMEEVSTRGPSRHVKFLNSDINNIYNFIKADPNLIKKWISDSPIIKPNWIVTNNPFNMLMGLMTIYYWNNMTENEKNAKSFKNTAVFMSMLILVIKLYSSLQLKYFPYGVDDEEMNALLDEMSGRCNITKFNSIYEYLEFVAYTNIKNAYQLLEYPTDYNIDYFIRNLDGRINSTIKGVASEFHERRNSGKKTSTDTLEKTNSEGDSYLDVADNVSNDIALVSRKILVKLSQDSSVNDKLLTIACKETKVSASKMKISINEMIQESRDLINQLITLIISYYLGTLKKPKSSIRSINFITLMKKVYGISNTNSEIVIRLKDTLETLMKKHSKEYLKTNRVATLSNLRATVYFYWVLYINAKSE